MLLSTIVERAHAFGDRDILILEIFDPHPGLLGIGRAGGVTVRFVVHRRKCSRNELGMNCGAAAHVDEFALRERPGRMIRKCKDPRGFIVDRNPGVTGERTVAGERRYGGVPRREPLVDAPIIALSVGLTARSDQHAAVRVDELDFWIAVLQHPARGLVGRVLDRAADGFLMQKP